MTLLSKDQILKAEDLPFETLPVPEWDTDTSIGEVRLRSLPESELSKYEDEMVSQEGQTKKVLIQYMRSRLLVLVIVDDKGNRIFNSYDIATLAKKSAKALDRVYTKAQEMNGLGKDYVEDMVKNLGTGPESDSNTDSQ